MRPARGTRRLLLAAALCAAGCGAGGDRERTASARDPGAPVTGGTVVVGVVSEFDGLNEFTSTDANATEVMEYMLYMPLLRWSKDLDLEGRLATSWEPSADGLEITMRLRDDVRWHDGVPTTAEDVVFTFDRCRDPLLGYPDVGGLKEIESVEALDPHTVRFRFRRAYASQLAHLRRVVLPKHLLADIPSDRMESAGFNRAPVGNGPFRLVRWVANQEIVFEANVDFPDGRPRLDRIVFRVIPDQTAVETAFLSGQLDIVERIRFESVGRLRREPRCRILTYPARGYTYIGWNLRLPLFADPRVRRALTLAIDREGLVEAVAFGEGRVAAHPVMSQSPFHASDIPPHPYDPEEAKRLLAAAGWVDRDGDGVRERDGRPFRFELVTNLGNRVREDALVVIQSDLAKVGVRMVPRVREWTVLLDETQAKRYDAVLGGWRTDFILAPYDIFHSAAIDGKYNSGSYSNPVVDRLIEEGLAARTAGEAAPAWHEFQRVLHEDQPYTVLFEQDFSVGTTPAVRGVEVDVRGWLLTVESWWLAGGGRRS
jgi:peptide/nickel transport system substrate-binding protein